MADEVDRRVIKGELHEEYYTKCRNDDDQKAG